MNSTLFLIGFDLLILSGLLVWGGGLAVMHIQDEYTKWRKRG